MTPEEREARRKQFEERMKNMPPEERAQWEARMRERGGSGGRRRRCGRTASGGSAQAVEGKPAATIEAVARERGQVATAIGANADPTHGAVRRPGSRRTTATTIDALFAPIPVVEGPRPCVAVHQQAAEVGPRAHRHHRRHVDRGARDARHRAAAGRHRGRHQRHDRPRTAAASGSAGFRQQSADAAARSARVAAVPGGGGGGGRGR